MSTKEIEASRQRYLLLLDYVSIAQRQLHDINIKPFLPQDMQKELEALNKRFREL